MLTLEEGRSTLDDNTLYVTIGDLNMPCNLVKQTVEMADVARQIRASTPDN